MFCLCSWNWEKYEWNYYETNLKKTTLKVQCKLRWQRHYSSVLKEDNESLESDLVIRLKYMVIFNLNTFNVVFIVLSNLIFSMFAKNINKMLQVVHSYIHIVLSYPCLNIWTVQIISPCFTQVNVPWRASMQNLKIAMAGAHGI